ncbi:response regulator transcription factor [Nocardioides marmoribigeumensis]|jgi:DNA-binding NarL/FixJ family response regulator|uniref:DNA-binding NarL/FixJ family response regulator n=1 Tax=Nocardioides marmoribigeumensis TaxID=433649 RepID=A0ABU2BW54_9ACTN|nr:response regulator transcription factor [Nocardioides marmoribigeumensis]MDR7362870.1 DNA-binding NarL/FixJ family response regulator [Nocardioides marmoribigeumensis]
MDRSHRRSPLRVDVVEACELVRAGLETMLTPYGVEVSADGAEQRADDGPDITLYDVPGTNLSREALDYLTERPRGGRLVLYAWDIRPDAVGTALAAGVKGYFSKSLSAASLVDALHRVALGDTVVRGRRVTPSAEVANADLTRRETQVLGLIASGMSNADIARATNLSINSVKTYIRGAYQKIGARNRAQALLWALHNGCVSDSSLAHPPYSARRGRRPLLTGSSS